jgi:hypothetical protein
MTSGTTKNLYGVWGSSSSDVFAVGLNGTILHYNGSNWSTMTSGTTEGLNGIWGSSANNVFAVGGTAEGVILHYNGSAWTLMLSGSIAPMEGIWGSSASDVYAVGDAGTILHYNGSTWSAMTSGTSEDINAVWGTSHSNVFAVGAAGTILHYDGNTWSAMTSNTTAHLYGIWGSSPKDTWAVGTADAITHYDGSVWSSTHYPILLNHKGIWGTSASQIFMVGVNGMFPGGYVKYFDGSSWSDMTIPDGCGALYGIYGSCSNNVFAVGAAGVILHYGNGPCPSSASVGTNLGAVSFSLDNGSISNLAHLRVADTRCSTPSGYDFPYGLFSFNISGINVGQTVKVTITFPRHLPNNYKYYKCIGNQLVDCTRITTRLNDNSLVLSLTDGGLGDADGLANGTIVDPGGPVEPVASAQVYGQGTMSTTITQQAPVALPAISVKSASLSATKVTQGTPVTVTADVANTGTSNGTANIKVYVNGQEESSQGVTVTSGSNTPLTFTVSRNEPGTYTVYVGGTSAGSFTVDWLADSNILIISGAAILFAFAIGVIFVTRRKQAH